MVDVGKSLKKKKEQAKSLTKQDLYSLVIYHRGRSQKYL